MKSRAARPGLAQASGIAGGFPRPGGAAQRTTGPRCHAMAFLLPHFETGPFECHAKHLPDREYADALDSLVKGCSDVLVTKHGGGAVLLGKRKVHPQPDYWFFGGRMFPGSTPKACAVKLLRRELGIHVSEDRLHSICCSSLAWAMREQAPKHHGTADVQLVLTIDLMDDEVTALNLDPGEYVASQWVPTVDVLAGCYHPALKHAVGALMSRHVYCDMERLAALSPSDDVDKALAAKGRELVAIRSRTADHLASSRYRLVAPDLQYDVSVATHNDGLAVAAGDGKGTVLETGKREEAAKG